MSGKEGGQKTRIARFGQRKRNREWEKNGTESGWLGKVARLNEGACDRKETRTPTGCEWQKTMVDLWFAMQLRNWGMAKKKNPGRAEWG